MTMTSASKIQWAAPPGGKRYTATGPNGRKLVVVRNNTAAGASRWTARVTTAFGDTYIAGHYDTLPQAKLAAATWNTSQWARR